MPENARDRPSKPRQNRLKNQPAQLSRTATRHLELFVAKATEASTPTITQQGGIPYLTGEFWTARQRQSHSIHEVSYRACFKAQLPAFFVESLTSVGDTVFDPFMGRGTTPVQAALMRRNAIGSDINPLSLLLTRPRMRPMSTSEIADALKSMTWTAGPTRNRHLHPFFHDATLCQIEALKQWLAEIAPLRDMAPETAADWIRMVAINRLTGHSPGFFSGRSMPPNQAVSLESQKKLNAKHGIEPQAKDVASIILKKTKSLLRDGCMPDGCKSLFEAAPAWDLKFVPDKSVHLVVTSPPFLDVVDYAQDNWLRCWFAGIDVQSVAIDTHRSVDRWRDMVHKTLAALAPKIKRHGHIAFEVGEVRNGTVLLEKEVWAAADGLPYERLCVVINQQDFTKTANCWGVDNGEKGTNTNRIVILRKK